MFFSPSFALTPPHGYTVAVPARFLSILLIALLALQVSLVGGRGVGMLCLGGGHGHPEVAEACGHPTVWSMPSGTRAHDDQCGCIDVVIDTADLISASRDEGFAAVYPAALPAIPPAAAFVAAGHPRRGPPSFPPWLDARRDHRLMVVGCTRLTI